MARERLPICHHSIVAASLWHDPGDKAVKLWIGAVAGSIRPNDVPGVECRLNLRESLQGLRRIVQGDLILFGNAKCEHVTGMHPAKYAECCGVGVFPPPARSIDSDHTAMISGDGSQVTHLGVFLFANAVDVIGFGRILCREISVHIPADDRAIPLQSNEGLHRLPIKPTKFVCGPLPFVISCPPLENKTLPRTGKFACHNRQHPLPPLPSMYHRGSVKTSSPGTH
jgi:hypothetical protein